MAVTKRTRFEVLRRDNHTCRYCGASAPDVKLTVDHVIPVALGGSDAPDNLVAACQDCNAGKSSTQADPALVADVREDALRWAAAMREAASQLAAEREARDWYISGFEVEWDKWAAASGRPVPRDDYMAGITSLYEAGLPESEMIEAVRAAMRAPGVALENRLRYFFGVAWSTTRRMQDIAASVVEAGT